MDSLVNGSGFYKNEYGVLLHGSEDVFGPTFTLLRDQHESYEYPVDGWYWFDTEEEARSFLGESLLDLSNDFNNNTDL
jgi:hypothetical protein